MEVNSMKLISVNKKASFDYFLLEKYEAESGNSLYRIILFHGADSFGNLVFFRSGFSADFHSVLPFSVDTVYHGSNHSFNCEKDLS